MKIKTSELAGKALDWAVAKCEGYKDQIAFSTCWEHGGPIIEREQISIEYPREGLVQCTKWKGKPQEFWYSSGFMPLPTAMRCYVASKLGDEVDVPEAPFNQKLIDDGPIDLPRTSLLPEQEAYNKAWRGLHALDPQYKDMSVKQIWGLLQEKE